MANVRIYSGSSGINNKLVAHRLPFDAKSGVAGLEAAYNVVIDKTGEVVTRRGTQQALDGAFHSLWPFLDSFFVVKDRPEENDSAIYRGLVDAEGAVTLHGIRDGLSMGAKMSYCEVAGKVYYMNGSNLGKTDGEISSPWPVSVPIRDTEAEMIATFAGHHLDMLAGNFVFAKDDEVFFTEYGLWGLIRSATARRRFESRVLMVCAVQSGVYVSDEHGVYFLQGNDPYKWQARKVLNYPAKEFCRVPGLIDPSNVGLETTQLSVMFGTVRGPVVGLPDGTAINLIDKAVTMLASCGGSHGGIMIVDDSLCIMSTEV